VDSIFSIVAFDADLKKNPESILLFPGISLLWLYGNHVPVLHTHLIKLTNLEVLQPDYNPISTHWAIKRSCKKPGSVKHKEN